MWGYAAAILRPLADWHGAPVDAPHFGHNTTLKLGFNIDPCTCFRSMFAACMALDDAAIPKEKMFNSAQ